MDPLCSSSSEPAWQDTLSRARDELCGGINYDEFVAEEYASPRCNKRARQQAQAYYADKRLDLGRCKGEDEDIDQPLGQKLNQLMKETDLQTSDQPECHSCKRFKPCGLHNFTDNVEVLSWSPRILLYPKFLRCVRVLAYWDFLAVCPCVLACVRVYERFRSKLDFCYGAGVQQENRVLSLFAILRGIACRCGSDPNPKRRP
jgi:hypothetical protein